MWLDSISFMFEPANTTKPDWLVIVLPTGISKTKKDLALSME
jgi:hypothetical protein